MEQTITIPSRRYYINELLADPANTPATIRSLADTFVRFNILVEWAYNRLYDAKILGKGLPCTLTAMLKQESLARFGRRVNDYTCSSVETRARALLSSQRELQKQYNEDHMERQDNRREKVQSLEDDLAKKQALKGLFAARARAKKSGLPFDDNAFAEYKISVSDDGVLFRARKNRIVKLDLYRYECMVDSQIRKLKTRIALISKKISRADKTWWDVPARATFGTKKQYRLKDTVCETSKDLEQWHRDRNFHRFHTVYFNGRHTSKDGNFQCKYDPAANTVRISLIDDTVLTLSDISFPYRGDDLLAKRLDPTHPSVSYSLEYRKDKKDREYFILKASITVSNDGMDFSTDNGVIAYDCNYDHIAWSDLNRDGCCAGYGVIPFSLEGKSSVEAKVILGNAMKELAHIAVDRQKPLAGEDLSIKKNRLEYGNQKANSHISGFAYAKMDELLRGQAVQNGIAIIKVNPAYTSFLGKIKYMRRMGTSIHCAAAYVIGRRSMGFTERLPASFRKTYYHVKKDKTIPNRSSPPLAACRTAFRHAKSIPPSFWYQREITFNSWKSLDRLVESHRAAKKPDHL